MIMRPVAKLESLQSRVGVMLSQRAIYSLYMADLPSLETHRQMQFSDHGMIGPLLHHAVKCNNNTVPQHVAASEQAPLRDDLAAVNHLRLPDLLACSCPFDIRGKHDLGVWRRV